MKPQIVNIVNFIRGVEPREPNLDLLEPVRGQITLLLRHRLRGTFLLQYDALLRRDIVEELLSTRDDGLFEYGVWLEVMQPLVEDAGLPWKGRYPWDWHTDVGFSISYTPAQREAIVDRLMEKFRQVFGYYPRSVGSWLIDAHTLDYLSQRYGIVASCNCKDQWGTDGYTMWGGYYNQAYYPSRRNAFAPAQTRQEQIPVPVFRMLGSDPIYQYDTGLDASFRPADAQDVYTLEPVYPSCGGSPRWIDWYLWENFNPLTLSFGYAQAGQENSFGWQKMKDGLSYQFERFASMQAEGRLAVQTLEESGRWFHAQYALTPASTTLAQTDWKGQAHQSFWYCSRFYRANLFWERGRLWMRDMYRFDESYEERYLHAKCEETSCCYDNLPVMDGNRWSGDGVRAGIYPVDAGGQPLAGGEPAVELPDDDTLCLSWPVGGGTLRVYCRPDSLEFRMDGGTTGWMLKFVTAPQVRMPVQGVTPQDLLFRYREHPYRIHADCGHFCDIAGALLARPQDGMIRWSVVS